MKVLSVECSATPCSVAVSCQGKVIASDFTNDKLTHSQTLMPMVKSVLEKADTDIRDIDVFAVSAGPGSFTGIRIGISAIKGMAMPRKTPCVSVSTLRAMAENCKNTDCIVCAVMDARCNQVYNGLFKNESGVTTRLCDDRALLCEDLAREVKQFAQKGERVIIVGDGTDVFYPFVKQETNVQVLDEENRYQNAVGVFYAAQDEINDKSFLSAEDLQPVYLRLPQAERELKMKKESTK